MITGYVSSDEDEDDDFYSDPLIRKNKASNVPPVRTEQLSRESLSALELNVKIKLFFEATEKSDLDTLERLLDVGVKVNCSGSSEWTPLMKACSSGNHAVVQFLLERGANPNLHKELFTPLMACSTNTYISEDDKLNCMRLLLEHDASVNAQDKYRMTALMYASGSGYKNIVDALLAVPSIDINLQDKEGWTALFHAVDNNHSEIVQKLVNAGICESLKDRFERTALDVALCKQFMEVATILGFTETNELMEDENIKENSFSEILNDIPTVCGDGGFSSDVKRILQNLTQVKFTSNVSLPEFLNYTETDLRKIGILFKLDRLKILKSTIHDYHLEPWKKSSMPPILSDTVQIEDAIAITSSLMKHLTIANASLKYLKTRIASRQNYNVPNLSTENEFITVLTNTYCVAKGLKTMLQQIVKHSNEQIICTPDDFIARHSENKIRKQRKHLKILQYAVGAAVGAYLIFQLNSKNKSFNFLVKTI